MKAVDWLVAGVLTALGVVLMGYGVTTDDAAFAREVAAGAAVHTLDSHSVWMVPLFAAATVPMLWWRRSVLVVSVIALAVMVLHDLLFGWVTRCGAGLPLAFVLTFLGALSHPRTKAWFVLAVTVLLCYAVLVVDASAGPGTMVLAVPVALLVFGVGRAARHRSALNRELQRRDEELRQLRDERAALVVADDRARLSRQFDGLLQERLDRIGRAAESAGGLEPARSRELLEQIEADSRQTMDDMREAVGLLRGGEADLTPSPTFAHLEALLAADARLTVTGDPRALPATVELSAFRIVESLAGALHGLDVAIRFSDEALQIRVNGAAGRGGKVRAAVTRARERARLLGGSVDVKVARGRVLVVAQLPVLS
ncbi:two-component sensor histidine kinase [Paractinoplanes abujensis]|uniref:Signal transduction histidine kinase n=1 Tax=Paractinoplanes abujensis TaxID=882441 RepID=A0A7W7G192_9ACTN|nr:hypothetical protein [Actinoplanes abujensis]MBB4692437.1 signal transduction histidine kinase [Actinoplanes abujensis]GID24085.1 two-component sensor histidine kinase [Actinoplanes abujensis]